MYKGELQSTLSNRMVFNVVAGYGGYLADYAPWRSNFAAPVVAGNPPRMDRETTLNLGANPKTNLEYRDKWQMDSGLSMFPERFLGGQHELKVGTTLYWRRNSVGWRVHPSGDYTLIFDRVNNVSNTPAEIQIRNSPTQPDSRAQYYAGYIKDTWRVNDRLTVNLGVRVEQQKSLLPEQSKDASPRFPTLFPAAHYDSLDVLTWNTVVPRFGLAWDVANRTIVKATFGRFVNGLDDGFANAYNPMANVTMTFRWRDLNNNRDYDAGEVILDPNGNDFLGVTGASSARLNPELKPAMTNESTIGIERELMQNLGVRALYVHKKVTNRFGTRNVARPRSAYNIPLNRRDPGPDGVLNTSDDGGMVTIYDYDPAFRGAAFVQNEQQNSDREDSFQTIEFTVTKRTSSRWGAMASFWAIKNHTWLNLFDDDPNADLNTLDETWKWAGNISGTYVMPLGIQLGAFVQSKVGILDQRTNIFRAVDPDGGPRLNQLSTVTLRLEPRGSQKTAAIHVVNLRGSKHFTLAQGHRLQFDFDVFNVFNSSSPITANFQSGPTFGYATAVVPPRIARIGFRYSF
jgi:outer membrane receptor protein involved in Fe transport